VQTYLKRYGNGSGEQFARAERFLDDAASGPMHLKIPRIAEIVRESILRGAAELRQYELLAYVVMPNHVHVLVRPRAELRCITGRIKGATSRAANVVLGRAGQPFWQGESFDHWARDAAEELKIKTYIERNPVKAKLAARAEDWPWSSAAAR
jgi:REP element-mobilizing transposase RayT